MTDARLVAALRLMRMGHAARAIDAQQQGDWLTRQYHEQTITDLNAVIELAYRGGHP